MKSYYRNKTILITGAASGIGRKFAETVAGYGVTLILWDKNISSLIDIRKSIDRTTEVMVTAVDVTDYRTISTEADQMIRGAFVPDIIVNCAGVVTGSYFVDMTPEQIEHTMMVNTTGSMFVARAFLPAMNERGSGQIVNLASAAGYFGNPKISVYSASKSAVIGWSESLRVELRESGSDVSVCCVIPSYIRTGMFEGVKAPVLVPILETGSLVRKMLRGIRRKRFRIQAPFMVRLVPVLKAVLPLRIFEWLAGRIFRVYRSMDTFRGRETESA